MGALLGGGVGRLQGLYGLYIDAVIKFSIALWNGEIVEASRDFNPDLFWGMRGAGHNLGIVTEATFRTWPATNAGSQYQADMVFALDAVTNLIDAINSLLPLPPGLSLLTMASITTATPKVSHLRKDIDTATGRLAKFIRSPQHVGQLTN
jgi:fumiquinazoline A oxidase